ncbi:MAG TPA: 3-oxoacyl-[acyl-carrier-protein] synthase III C-terminal domain-containing protein [Candidatus Dormibacteraeota bacterium]|jgi:alkylresorcinol/alkylpyrone synthase|nr:3-oxoacyl-[acyl-carrier-protein] synthase III C-terminal domain-containing protein [Candidatus Dormibacteraeota bacterium]
MTPLPPAVHARVLTVATAVPLVSASVDEVWDALGQARGRRLPRPAGIEGARTRYFAEPLSSLMAPRSQSHKTDAYLEHGRVLARQVCCEALEASGVARPDIGLLIGVSCTGVVLPSLDAELIPILGLDPVVARLPITELGCGGGIGGMARALDYLRAYPDRAVLLFAVELPSLTFQPEDHSVDNLVAAMVFGDGAGALVVQAADAADDCVIEQCGTMLVPAGARYLGYELRDGGLRVVLSRELPHVVEQHLESAVTSFLAGAGLTINDIDLVAAHPGGPRIFDAVDRALRLAPQMLDVSREVFDAYGNASSAGIFFVLDELRRRGADGRALAIAFGPGLSIELALMRLG